MRKIRCAEKCSNAQNMRHPIDEETAWKIVLLKNCQKCRQRAKKLLTTSAALRNCVPEYSVIDFSEKKNRRESLKRRYGNHIHFIVQQLHSFHTHTHSHFRNRVHFENSFVCQNRRHMHSTHSKHLPYVRAIENGYSNRWRKKFVFFATTKKTLSFNTKIKMISMQPLSIRLLNEIQSIHKYFNERKNSEKQ